MFEAAAGLREEFAALEQQLADPALHTDLAASRRVGRRYNELSPIVRGLAVHDQLSADLEAARELAEEDPSFAAEADAIAADLATVDEKLTRLLAPRDPNDSADCLIEIKSGEGGEESALFAGDLFRMYAKFAETRGWKVEVLDSQDTDLG
ncbi:MAG: PCRF domain-containing protein, partial [Propionicimonas sp.]